MTKRRSRTRPEATEKKSREDFPAEERIFGFAKEIITVNNNLIIDIRVNIDQILAELFEDADTYQKVEKFAGWLNNDGEFILKLKAIPLGEKHETEFKTHIIKLDYFEPDPEKAGSKKRKR
jgi:hypothetical protein